MRRVGEIPKGAIPVTADVVGLYPSIPHDGGLEVLRKQSDKFKDKIVPTENIIRMVDFVVKNNLFEFDCKFCQQISGTVIGTKSPHIFFIWTDFQENLNKFLKDLKEFHPNLQFTYEKSKEKINFSYLVIKLTDGKIVTDLYCKSTDSHQYLHYDLYHAEHFKR